MQIAVCYVCTPQNETEEWESATDSRRRYGLNSLRIDLGSSKIPNFSRKDVASFVNVVCPWCGLALAVFWVRLWYTAIYHRTVTKPLMQLYECKVLLVSYICFFPTDEWTLVLDYCKGEPEFLLWVIFCVYLLLYAGLRLLHLTVAQILYTMHVLFIQDIFTAQIFANMF